jgi:hypothetical protein
MRRAREERYQSPSFRPALDRERERADHVRRVASRELRPVRVVFAVAYI